ncbi:hypothetical protein C2134_01725 [Chromobacterium sinusclupearum]|uniref:Transferrin-binding protein B C-lobe/N-lobe beta barrel domain-containing protein n=1 Tax=Chromobacterium sinusclupearum TaxID=2077146 RepID=A0A2K4MTA3_9NEIS|nr:hypothetical protein C2134_01725 [Chromobacterium sinusclupearum]
MLYSRSGISALLDGFITGNLKYNGSNFSSSGLDYNMYSGILSVGVNGSFTANQLTVTSSYANGDKSTTSAPSLPGSGQAASLSAIAGNLAGNSYVPRSGMDGIIVNVANNGQISGQSTISGSGCRFNGTITPDAKLNLYTVSLTFLNNNCALGAGTSVNGAAMLDTQTGRLLGAATTGQSGQGIMFDLHK